MHRNKELRKIPEETLTAWPSLDFLLDPLTAFNFSPRPLDLTLTPVMNGSTGAYVVSPPWCTQTHTCIYIKLTKTTIQLSLLRIPSLCVCAPMYIIYTSKVIEATSISKFNWGQTSLASIYMAGSLQLPQAPVDLAKHWFMSSCLESSLSWCF